ncbi:hypothetical protein [Granulicella sp. WH15]|nr:hypothetical protein [Granulicella sp. WH15]
MQKKYIAPAVVTVLDATAAIQGIAKIGVAELGTGNQTTPPSYSDLGD